MPPFAYASIGGQVACALQKQIRTLFNVCLCSGGATQAQRCRPNLRGVAVVLIVVCDIMSASRGDAASRSATVAESNVCGSIGAERSQPSGAIQGQIFDDQHKPVRGASVSVQRAQSPGAAPSSTRFERTVVTNAKGEYLVAGVPPDEYYVSAVIKTAGSFTANPRDHTRQPQTTGFGPTFYPGTTWSAYAHRVFVYPGEQVAGIDITLEKKKLGRVSGKITSRHTLKDGAYV